MIIISNGFNKFFLAVAAAEMNKRSLLSVFITGAYPKSLALNIFKRITASNGNKIARFLNRKEEIDEKLVYSTWFSEAIYKAGLYIKQEQGLFNLGERLERAGFRLYGRRAVSAVRSGAEKGARIYHYRSGFGHQSVAVAKKLGLFTLCDHSIVHPQVLNVLVENAGRMPSCESAYTMTALWNDINEDIKRADAVLVNSQFVKDTFVGMGWKEDLIHVIYLGVDEQFLNIVARIPEPKRSGRTFRFLFAGGGEKRKGAADVLKALRLLKDEDIELRIAGHVSGEIRDTFRNDLKGPRIRQLGWLSRLDLAQEMVSSDCFVFPSLAEGSARGVFEALACGCYVITTPNSGSIVRDGVHGRLIKAGDVDTLASAMRETIRLPKDRLREVGQNNAREVRSHYRQSQYGDKLQALYQDIIKARPELPCS